MTTLIRADEHVVRQHLHNKSYLPGRPFWRRVDQARTHMLLALQTIGGRRSFTLEPGDTIISTYPAPGFFAVPSRTTAYKAEGVLFIDGEDIFGRKTYQANQGDGEYHIIYTGAPADKPFQRVSLERVVSPPQQPDEYISTPGRGWRAFAHSAESMTGSGGARFKVPDNVEGVAIGLSHRHTPSDGSHTHIPYGLLFTGKKVKRLHDGKELGAYTSDDEFTLELHRGRYYVRKNGEVLDETRSPYSLRLPWWLCAAMHRDKDRVVDAELFALTGAGGAMTLPALRLAGGRIPTRDGAHMSLQPLVMQAATGASPWGAALMLQPLAMKGRATKAQRAAARMTLQNLTLRGRASPAVHQTTSARMVLRPMVMQAATVEPPVARGKMTLPPLNMKGGKRPATGGRMALSSLAMFGLAQPRSITQQVFEFLGNQVEAHTQSIRIQLINEGLQLATFSISARVLLAQIDEQLGLHTESAPLLSLQVSIHEYWTLHDDWPRRNKLRDTWVVNINTGASTTYSGFDFNSYCERDGEYFAANEQGIHRLDGDTDNGEKIRAAIQLGDIDFSHSTFKGISECYVGVKTSGQLVLRVVAHGKEYFYESQRLSELMREHRFVTGKGLRANYLTLELYNKDGADFELDKVEFRAVHKTRRV